MHTGGVRGGRRGTPHVPPLKNLKMTLHLWVNHSRVSRSPCCVGLYFISQSGLGIHRVIQTTCKFHSRLLGIIFMVNFLYVFFSFFCLKSEFNNFYLETSPFFTFKMYVLIGNPSMKPLTRSVYCFKIKFSGLLLLQSIIAQIFIETMFGYFTVLRIKAGMKACFNIERF